MIDLVACSFPTINIKSNVTLPNFVESKKATLEKKIEDFHTLGGA
jgi:bifunctional N-acetylglucosamine-1-phosphate-uridyltransferase/glucosamine-1-phosphate-acetyltransferase GlmU-like protein